MKVRSHTLRVVAALAAAGFLCVSLGGAAAPATSSPSSGAGPHFYGGLTVDVPGAVDGDVYAAGQTVTISGDVTGDVIAAAQTISISGRVDGNVRLAAQSVTISGHVTRSGTIVAGNLLIDGHGTVGQDIVATASTVDVAGAVGRDLVVSATDLSIDGTVGGDVTYSSSSTAHIADGAVGGAVTHLQPQQPSQVEISPWAAALAWLVGLLYAIVALSLITVVAGLVVPRVLGNVTDRLLISPWRALLVGFIAAIAVPIGLLILLVTIVGAPLALALLLVFTVLTLATFLVGAHFLGRVILRGAAHPVLQSFVGGLILIAGLQIPLLNILVWLAMVFFGLGAELLEIHRRHPWSTKPRPEESASAGETGPVVAGTSPTQQA